MIVDFNANWTFQPQAGRPKPVCLPHDAMLAEQRDAGCRSGKQSGYFPGGKYTYKKMFSIPAEWLGKPSDCGLRESTRTAG